LKGINKTEENNLFKNLDAQEGDADPNILLEEMEEEDENMCLEDL